MDAVISSSLPILAIGGSRRLSPAGSETVRLITGHLLKSGFSLAVGCATGADAAVLKAAVAGGIASQLHIFTAFGPITGSAASWAVAGSGSCSAPFAVRDAAAAGARVTPWAGGGPDLSFPSRLSNRTRTVARNATAGGIVICDGPPVGPGSSLLVRSLAARGLPVWLFPVEWKHLYGDWTLPVNGTWHWGWHCWQVNIPAWHLPASIGQGSLGLAA